jgi:hypothetical protein
MINLKDKKFNIIVLIIHLFLFNLRYFLIDLYII